MSTLTFLRCCSLTISLLLLCAETARADEAPLAPTDERTWSLSAPASGYSEPSGLTLSSAQRASITLGVEDLGAATEQSLLATVLYVTSAATLITGIVTSVVLLAELAPPGLGLLAADGSWGDAELAVLGTAIGCFLVHGVTTSLAITQGERARRRHDRARRELLLTQVAVSPLGMTIAGSF